MEFQKTNLGELSVNGKGSYGIAASAVPYSDELFTYLRITDINDDGTLNKSGLMSVSDEKAEQYLLKPNDIVFARTGGSTGRSYFYDGTDGEFVYAGFLIKFSIDSTKVNPRFIKYYCLSQEYRGWVHSFNTGSTRGNINAQTYANMPILLPSREQQDLLVDTLSVIDEKIKLNTAINENLEQQAQAIFKAWFVDFEPFGGVMPDDWRMGTLSEICGYSKDKVDIDDLTLDTYYSTENMQPNRQGAVQATTLPTIKQTTACKKGDVLISNIRPYFKKILYCFSDCGCSTDVLCFVPNKTDYSAFLYCALYADKFFDYMVTGSKGTKMPRGDKQQIMVYPICIPSAEYIEKFNQAVAPMLETVYTNRIEANDLANLRDTLLPKLMNGEIDVSAVKI